MCTSLWIQMGSQLKQYPYFRGSCPTLAHIGTQLLQNCLPQLLVFLIVPENVSEVLINTSNQLFRKLSCRTCHFRGCDCLPVLTCHHPPHCLGSAVAGTTLNCAVICKVAGKTLFIPLLWCTLLLLVWSIPSLPDPAFRVFNSLPSLISIHRTDLTPKVAEFWDECEMTDMTLHSEKLFL